MRSVIIPVSPFSKKILTKEFGNEEPFVIDPADILSQSLRAARAVKLKLAESELLNTTATLVVSDDLARHIQKYPASAGMNLHRYHREKLYETCATTALMGGQPYGAIKRFFDDYSIGEDDFALETAQRGFTRFREKKEKKIGQKTEQMRRRLSNEKPNNLPARKVRKEVVPRERIEQWHGSIWERVCQHLKHPPLRLSKQLRAYLYIEVGGYSARQAAQYLRVKHVTCFESYKRMQQQTLRRKPWLKAIIEETITALLLIKTIGTAPSLGHVATSCSS